MLAMRLLMPEPQAADTRDAADDLLSHSPLKNDALKNYHTSKQNYYCKMFISRDLRTHFSCRHPILSDPRFPITIINL